MEQPRQQHYHFAYSALPSKIFAGHVAGMLLAAFPESFSCVLFRLWEVLGEQLPPDEHASVEGMRVTSHRIGHRHLVVLIHMPPPERMLETYFVAVVYTPEVRYFTLGRGVILGDDGGFERTTFREVTPEANINRGPTMGASAETMLQRLCEALGLEYHVDDISDEEIRTIAPTIPAVGPTVFDTPPTQSIPKAIKPWWQFWK